MFDLLTCAFCSTHSVWSTCSVPINTTPLNEREIAINPATPSPLLFDQPADAYAEVTIFSDPEILQKKYELETKLEKLKTLKISEKTIDTLASYIENESNEEHKKVLVNNLEWYACVCDAISNSLAKTISERTIIIGPPEIDTWVNWLEYFNGCFERCEIQFEQLKNNNFKNNKFCKNNIRDNKLKFQDNYDTFKVFYNKYINFYNTNCKENNAWANESHIKAAAVVEDVDEELCNWILECNKKRLWDPADSTQFDSISGLLQCTNYKVNNYIYFVINKGTTYNNKSILYYVYFK